jgi:tetratricopeptide (TPR) repeat protein
MSLTMMLNPSKMISPLLLAWLVLGNSPANTAEPTPAETRKQLIAIWKRASTGPAKAAALIDLGGTYASEKNHAAARAEFEKALATPGLAPDQAGRALLQLADGYAREYKWQPAQAALEKAMALRGVSNAVKIDAHIAAGGIFEKYGDWPKVKGAYSEALKFTDMAPERKAAARRAMAKALVNLKEYAAARAVMRELLVAETAPTDAVHQTIPRTVLKEYVAGKISPDTERAMIQMSLAKTLHDEGGFAEARSEFAKAQAMPKLTDALKAEIQLYIGLSYYDAKDYERAKPELAKVLAMPGAGTRPAWDGGRIGYVPAREAMLRLHLRNLVAEDRKVLKVLFIGSSHTLRGDIPELVAKLAASAPADRPRIIAGDYVRMGTTIKTFWNAGDTPDTARGVIAAEPWDAVVFETFYNMQADELLKYGTLFADLIRARKAAPVIYESPIAMASAYPAVFQKFHDDNLALVKALRTPAAPSVAAWMRYLGPTPTPERFSAVYADWIHATPAGAYMSACCIYSALTGYSPVGLAHPNLSADEASVLQQAAWQAFQETNPNLNR